jgi:hypothetical protein
MSFPASVHVSPCPMWRCARSWAHGARRDITVHGFRSTFRDWVGESTAFSGAVAEAAVAHVVGDKVEAAYRRGDLFEKRRKLMAAWATSARRRPRARRSFPTGRGSRTWQSARRFGLKIKNRVFPKLAPLRRGPRNTRTGSPRKYIHTRRGQLGAHR